MCVLLRAPALPCARCAWRAARECLLLSIHEVDALTAEIEAMPISRHIEVATPKKDVVPIAMLMATKRVSAVESAAACHDRTAACHATL